MVFLRDKYVVGLLSMLFAWHGATAHAASTAAFRLEQETQTLAKQKITSLLTKYCGDSCEMIHVETVIDEMSAEPEDVGFESVVGDANPRLSVAQLVIDLQVDDRVSSADRDRLGKLVVNALKNLAPTVNVRWSSVAFPQIGVSAEVEDRLKTQIQQKIQSVVQGVIDQYCPSECILTNSMVDGRLVAPDEARGVSERELVRDRSGRGILRLDNVDIDLSIDEKMSEANRTKIYNLVKAKTRFAYPVNVNVSVVDFPATPSAAKGLADDPWGLDRLRQTLQIFRDLAGTKEIITNTQATSQHEVQSESKTASERTDLRESREMQSSKERSSATESLTSSLSSSINNKESEVSRANEILSESKSESEKTWQYALYIGAFLLLAGIVVAMIMRFSAAAKDARIMMQEAPGTSRDQLRPGYPSQGAQAHQSGSQQIAVTSYSPEKMSLRLKIDGLRDEILKIFTENPKVARDVFTRMLQEDGVEATSKYVHVFGPLVIFELMNDPNLQRDLYDLGEYYYKSTFAFTEEQTLELLTGLKTRITASEIKLMTRRRAEQFDFLQKLDAPQVFLLLRDEKPQVQSIAMTQLDHQRRRAVFDMYEGNAKVELMRELCRADAIPKEYLANVAKALHKKVLSRGDFDTEQLRSSDIIFDLLEKAPLHEQRTLMADLVQTNPETARAIKLKLVTVEMLSYLKDGHLLEIVMGLEREDLLAFLVGTPDHIRELLLNKAPRELAASWIEDIDQMTNVEEATYRLAELKIINRLRTLANNGAIRLLDINDRIFAEEHLAAIRSQRERMDVAVSRNSVAA